MISSGLEVKETCLLLMKAGECEGIAGTDLPLPIPRVVVVRVLGDISDVAVTEEDWPKVLALFLVGSGCTMLIVEAERHGLPVLGYAHTRHTAFTKSEGESGREPVLVDSLPRM